MKYFSILIILFTCSCTANIQKRIVGKDSTNIVIVDHGDKEMEAAINAARLSLSMFDSALFSNNPNYNSFALKVRFAYDNNSGEHIWLAGITKNQDEYSGIVNNEPEYIPTLKLYDTVRINKKDISDWMYLDKDILKGGFTVKLIRNRMSVEERAQYDSGSFYKTDD